jgi:hypothetical protein
MQSSNGKPSNGEPRKNDFAKLSRRVVAAMASSRKRRPFRSVLCSLIRRFVRQPWHCRHVETWNLSVNQPEARLF